MATKKSKNPWTSLTAGCIAGGVEATAVWPMEYIKTQLQLQSKVKGVVLPYHNMLSGLRYTVQTTGFFSLYQGLAPTLLGSVPKAGIRFGLNSYLKEQFRKFNKDASLTLGQQFLAGLGAGVTEALIIVAPVETIKTQCIERNQSFLQGMKHILQTKGISGIYQGATATALKQGSNQGLRFMWFNEYKRIVTQHKDPTQQALTPIGGLLGGMSAGCFSTLGNNPFDVVKTRMQGSQASTQYTSTLDCVQQIARKEGIAAFYAGVVPRLGRVVPGQGIIFMSFESIQSALERNFSIFRAP